MFDNFCYAFTNHPSGTSEVLVEADQKKDPTLGHHCLLTSERLYHRGEHPKIPKPQDCIFWERRE